MTRLTRTGLAIIAGSIISCCYLTPLSYAGVSPEKPRLVVLVVVD